MSTTIEQKLHLLKSYILFISKTISNFKWISLDKLDSYRVEKDVYLLTGQKNAACPEAARTKFLIT